MNIKKTFPIPFFILTMSLVACGRSDVSSSDNSKSEIDSSSEKIGSSSENTKPTNIEFDFWHTFGQGIEEGVQAYVDDFEQIIKQEEGVDLTINLSKEGSYTDILKKIMTGIGQGNSPTLAVAYPDHVAQYLNNESTKGQFVVDLSKYINDEKIGFGTEEYLGDIDGTTVYDSNDFVQVFFDEGTSYVEDGTYSIPLMKSTEVMMYNMNIVQKALIKLYPTVGYDSQELVKAYMDGIAWEKLLEVADCIVKNKDEFNVPNMEYPIFYDSDSNMFISSMYQKEIPYSTIGEDKKGLIQFDYKTNEENYNKTKDLVDYFVDAHKNGLLTTKGAKGEYGSYSFTDEKCAITIGSSGGAGYNAPKTVDQFTVEVSRPPVFNNNPLYVNQGVTLTMLNNVSLSAEDNYWKQYYAWKFIKFLTNPSVNSVLCIEDSQGYVPVRYSAYETAEFQEWLDQPETIMIQSARTVMEMNDAASYYTAKSFSGASELRDQCGGVISALFLDVEKDHPETTTDAVLKQAIDAAKTKF